MSSHSAARRVLLRSDGDDPVSLAVGSEGTPAPFELALGGVRVLTLELLVDASALSGTYPVLDDLVFEPGPLAAPPLR